MEVTQRLKYPSLLRRYVASLIDGSVLFFLFLLYVQHPWRSPQTGSIHYWPLISLALYEPLLTRYLCTLGQYLMWIRIRTEPGIEPVPVWRTVLRLSVKYSLGIISFLFLPAHPQKRALHDLAADTIVVNARDVDSWRGIARNRQIGTPDPVGSKRKFPGWLTAALLLPLPAVLCSSVAASLIGTSRNPTLLLSLGIAVLAWGMIACAAATIAIVSIARGRAQLSVRNLAQIAPAAFLTVTLVFLEGYAFVDHHAWVHAQGR
jgi:uncharacterized RDD family membrane protein YckC